MTVVRRVYIYVVAFAALATCALGVANLLRALLEELVSTASAASPGYLSDQVSLWGAAALVGLPIWYLHWAWAQRSSQHTIERSSSLRRLFLYATLAGSTITVWIALDEVVTGLMQVFVGAGASVLRMAIPPLPLICVGVGVWSYYWRIAAADRNATGETGASGTLRRWYVYGFAWSGLLSVLIGAQTVLMTSWLRITSGLVGYELGVPGASVAVVGLCVWTLHWVVLPRWLNPRNRREDERSTLRSVYLFLGLAVVLLATLGGISQALYYMLARVLGVASPGGVGGSLLQAAAGPLSVAVVYGTGWWYQRSAIARSAGQLDGSHQVGVRRTYEYLTALLALAVLAVGVAGLLWILGDVITHSSDSLGADWWRDRLSLFVTLTVVGLAAWLLHWRPRAASEAQSLARRIYLYAALVCAMLALLGSGAVTVYRVLSMAMGSGGSSATIDLSHALAVCIVAAGTAAYHWRVVRTDLSVPVPAAEAPAHVVVELTAANGTTIDAALDVLRAQGITVLRRAA